MRRVLKFLALVGLFILLVMGAALGYFFRTYPSVGEIPEISLPTEPDRIERGHYLAAHVTLCVECHSVRDFSRYAGPIDKNRLGVGGDKFEGDFGLLYAPNITPAGIGSWSDTELYRAVATGVTPGGTSLFPLMPYLHYGRLDRRDLEDILAYVRTLDSEESEVPASRLNFPLNLLVRTMPAPAQPQTRPDPEDKIAYGEYLLNAAACAECHTPRDRGAAIPGMTLAGGLEMQTPWGRIRSTNITPDRETGIGSWTRKQFIARFKSPDQRHNRGDQVAPGEFNTIMPWSSYAGMTEEDLGALYDYLQTVPSVHHKVKLSDFP